MVNEKSRDHDKRVTAFLPILIPAAGEKPDGRALLPGSLTRTHGPDGEVLFQKDRETEIQPVRLFTRDKELAPERFSAIARMYSLASGKKIDYSLVQESFRSLVENVFGRPLTDAISKGASENPKGWSKRWLSPIFNKEIDSVRLVMWWPTRKLVFRPAIYCPDRVTAHFVNLLFSGITACLGCGTIFSPHRPNQIYHDNNCANRHRKRRERRRKRD